MSKIPLPVCMVLGIFGHEGHVLCWHFADFQEQCSFRCDALFSSELLFSEKSFWLTVLDGIEMWFVLCLSTPILWGNNISKPKSVLKSLREKCSTQSLLPWIRVILHAHAATYQRSQTNYTSAFTLWYKAVCRCKTPCKVLNKRAYNSPRIQF